MKNQTYKPKVEIIMSEDDEDITLEFKRDGCLWSRNSVPKDEKDKRLIEMARDVGRRIKIFDDCGLGEYQVLNGFSSGSGWLFYEKLPTKKVNARDYSTINFSILLEMLGIPEEKTLGAYAA